MSTESAIEAPAPPPELTERQRVTLRAFVDTAVPAVERPDDPTGFWSTPGTATGADFGLAAYLDTLIPELRAGLLSLVDALAAAGFPEQGREAREAIRAAVAGAGPEARIGIQTLTQVACLLAYSLPNAEGGNPYWAQLGYPGPRQTPPPVPKTITPLVPEGDELTLEADVVVVGSGAGGGTIAGVLAGQGRDVVVLEAGGYFNEADFVQYETIAHLALFYRGGLTATADGNVVCLAGANLGGGTTINWQNCVQPSPRVREQWAREHGLEGLDGPEFDRHLAAVMARMSVTEQCSDFNGPHQRMAEAADKLGWSLRRAARNADPATYDPELAGYTHFGDVTGSKQGTLKTYLQDAFDAGARILVRTRAERVLVEGGRAAGVSATYTGGPAPVRVTVRAPQVVVACGALETPALLLRSGIGGPAVGHHLRLHPATTTFGVYAEDQRAWWGPTQAAVLDEFAGVDDGYGYLIEGSQYYTGIFAAFLPWTSGEGHKETMAKLARMSPLLFVLRDRGSGRVTVDAQGEAVHTYALSDEGDQRLFREALGNLLRVHEAAGAEEIYYAVPELGHWRRGEDLEDWIARLQALPIGAGGLPMGCAHQMGSARMGRDPQSSVADPRGELHDTPGVWIGDTSAFPTASGANPMLTCMALAHRTAEMISGVRDEPSAPVDLSEVAEPVT